MVDTVRIPRLPSERRKGGPGGRVEHDSRGTAVWVRTRSTDAQDSLSDLDLTIERSAGERVAGRMVRSSSPYYEYKGPSDASGVRRKPTDLQALSRWITVKKSVADSSDE